MKIFGAAPERAPGDLWTNFKSYLCRIAVLLFYSSDDMNVDGPLEFILPLKIMWEFLHSSPRFTPSEESFISIFYYLNSQVFHPFSSSSHIHLVSTNKVKHLSGLYLAYNSKLTLLSFTISSSIGKARLLDVL